MRKTTIHSNPHLSGSSEVYIYLTNGVWFNFYSIMTINPTLGHLYHDFSISNAYTALDAQELFKTRQRNAREKRQLDEFTRSLNKAQDINLRRLELEEISVRHQLNDINLRSPSLRTGLRKQSLRRSQSFSIASPSTLSSAFQSKCASAAPSRVSYSSSQNSGTSQSSAGSGEFQLNRSKSQMFVRKVNNVTKSLSKLYEKQQRRKVERAILLRNVRKDNEELLQKSRVYFKDSDITHNLEEILGETCNISDETVPQKATDNPAKQDVEYTEQLTLPNINNAIALEKGTNSTLFPMDNLSTEVQPSRSDDFDLSEFKVSSRSSRTIPEVWQLYKKKVSHNDEDVREPLLVTITARYRRTLVD